MVDFHPGPDINHLPPGRLTEPYKLLWFEKLLMS